MDLCFFVADLHGRRARYDALFAAIRRERPAAVLLGGDLLPALSLHTTELHDFLDDVLAAGFRDLRAEAPENYPSVFLILGNDDPRNQEPRVAAYGAAGLWSYVHFQRVPWNGFVVCGYACVPPTPFHLKDWERYDVSRYVDPGCCSPEEGYRTVEIDAFEVRHGTILKDLDRLAGPEPLERAICLFHAPPYRTTLDRIPDGLVEGVPRDPHVGSMAVRRFIESRQPLLTLHGHIHESARLTGGWRDRIGRTVVLGAAHDGPELALIRFDPAKPELATRELL